MSPETIRLLWRIYRKSIHHQVRQRAHCILLSNQGMTIAQLISIFQVTRKTIYNWFLAWNKHHLVGLYDASGRGRKPTFTEEQKHPIRLWVKETPKNLSLVLKRIQKTWNIETSKETLKRVLKSLSMSWHRLRCLSVRTPNPIEYQLKRLAFAQIQKQAEAGEIDLRFCDESGFSLRHQVEICWLPPYSPHLNLIEIL